MCRLPWWSTPFRKTSTGVTFQSRNFSLQKQFGQGWVVQASYAGTLVVHQFSQIDVNAGQVMGAGLARAITE